MFPGLPSENRCLDSGSIPRLPSCAGEQALGLVRARREGGRDLKKVGCTDSYTALTRAADSILLETLREGKLTSPPADPRRSHHDGPPALAGYQKNCETSAPPLGHTYF